MLVMPGLDPGIHDDRQRTLTVRMDCRVKPGNDEEKSSPGMTVARRDCHFLAAI
jgi:hypothetical protein